MPQTTYNLDPSAAVAGQVVDKGRLIGKYVAAEELPPGRFVVLNSSNKWELPQGSSLGKVGGVTVYRSSKDPGPYAVGDFVPVLRSGSIWCESTASAPADLASANVRHSSTIATHRGKVTDAATSATPGSEISDPGPVLFYGTGPTGLVLVELAFPGVDSDDDTRLDALESVKIQKKSVTVLYTDFTATADGAAEDINVGTALPAGAVLLGSRFTINTPFAGAGVATLTMIVGHSADTDAALTTSDILGDAAAEYGGLLQGAGIGGPAGSKQLVANFDPDNAGGLDELTAGSVTIDVLYCVI